MARKPFDLASLVGETDMSEIELFYAYLFANGLAPNENTKLMFLKKSAERGNKEAQYQLAINFAIQDNASSTRPSRSADFTSARNSPASVQMR